MAGCKCFWCISIPLRYDCEVSSSFILAAFITFQFHLGTIASQCRRLGVRCIYTFQFHLGTIASEWISRWDGLLSIISIPLRYDCENNAANTWRCWTEISIPLRYDCEGAGLSDANKFFSSFQFHLGTIASWYIPVYSWWFYISIPLRYDCEEWKKASFRTICYFNST